MRIELSFGPIPGVNILFCWNSRVLSGRKNSAYANRRLYSLASLQSLRNCIHGKVSNINLGLIKKSSAALPQRGSVDLQPIGGGRVTGKAARRDEDGVAAQ